MTKAEYIAKYGEEAYKAHIEKVKARYKKNRTEILEQQNLKYHTDTEYKEIHKARNRDCDKRRWQTDAGRFVVAQCRTSNRHNITDWKQYNLDILENEANNIDHNKQLLDEEFLYVHFIDNVKSNMYYGNIQILKYFVPLMCIKLYENKEFTAHNIEMIKYFESFENKTKKKPITYNKVLCYMPKDAKNDNDNNIKYMLLYNLSANFIINCTKYPTEKKLY